MRIEHTNTVKVDELADLIPRKAGATWSSLWQIFFYTRLFKYVHRKQYPTIKKSFNKITTDKNLKKLCDRGYLKCTSNHVYCATNKVLPILKEAGYSIDILPKEPVGKGDVNELNNTKVFIHLTKIDHFHTLLFPQFRYLIPDALMVQLDRANKKYKLTFIEVEQKKPKWEEYIENKKTNYTRLSKDLLFYDTWLSYCTKLDLPKPELNSVKFSYLIFKDPDKLNNLITVE